MLLPILLALAQAPVAEPRSIPAVADDLPRGFGYAVELCGDLDGDGHSEFAIGGRGWIGFPADVLIYGGRDGNVLRRITTTGENEFIRGPMVRTGDLDGDHVDDLAVSIGSASGRVEIRSGKSGSVVRTLSPIEGEVDFGIGLCRLGDVDADGVNDLVITAGVREDDENAKRSAVRWLVISGATGARLQTVAWKGPVGREWSYSQQNPSAVALGDVNADKKPDFAVIDELQVRVQSGARLEQLHSFELVEQKAKRGFRFSVCGGFDLDGDSHADIAVATPFANGRDYDGSYDFLRVYSGASGKVLRTITSSSKDHSGFGFSLATTVERGSVDLWVARYDWLGNGLSKLSLQDGHEHNDVPVSLNWFGFGWSIANGADVNGDGVDDMIVADFTPYASNIPSGGGHVYSGKDGTVIYEKFLDPVSAALRCGADSK